jgi:outer membrane biosynthesis protein TonB
MHHRFTKTALILIYSTTILAAGRLHADVTLSWDPDSDPFIVGYRLYLGTTSGVYTQTAEAGSATSVLISNLVAGKTYYFAVSAYNSSAVQSTFSNQVSYTVPATSPTPTPTASPSPTVTPAPTPTQTATPQPSQTPSPTPSVSPSPSVTPSPTPTPGRGPARMVSPVPGSTFTSSTVTFNWTPGSATKYVVFVGRVPSSVDYYVSGIISTLSCVAPNMPTDGRTIYVTLGSQVNGSWTFNQYTYKAFSSFSTPTPTPTPVPSPSPSPTPTPTSTPTPTPTPTSGGAAMLRPAPGSTLSSSSVTFQWSAGSATAYGLVVGSSPGSGSIYTSPQLSVHSITVNNIPTDGRTIYVRLYSKVKGSWVFNRYTYKAQ